MINFEIITIFPEIFDSYFNESIIKRAQKNKLIKINIHDLRKWTKGRHKQVDDRPYGGGPGMILMVEPIAKAVAELKKSKNPASTAKRGEQKINKAIKQRIIMLTPAGKRFTQREAERLAKYDRLILLCGRYEGFDARVDELVDEKISIGDYVLAGGEIPAMVVAEAVARQVPGVVGHEHALDEETFSKGLDYIEYPQYTRPESIKFEVSARGGSASGGKSSKFKVYKVPKVLLSGDHKKIREWRKKNSKLVE